MIEKRRVYRINEIQENLFVICSYTDEGLLKLFNSCNSWLLKNHFPLKTGFLFSKKAPVPSFLSSLEKTSPNNFASSLNPSTLK